VGARPVTAGVFGLLIAVAVSACGGSGGMTESQAQVQHCGYSGLPTSGRPVPPGPTMVSGGTTCAEALDLYRAGDAFSPWDCRSKHQAGRGSLVIVNICTNGTKVARFSGLTP
jgi:hypothetical protein